jgi:hypothetical protein
MTSKELILTSVSVKCLQYLAGGNSEKTSLSVFNWWKVLNQACHSRHASRPPISASFDPVKRLV